MADEDVFTRSARALNKDITTYVTAETRAQVLSALKHSSDVLMLLRSQMQISQALQNGIDFAVQLNRNAERRLR